MDMSDNILLLHEKSLCLENIIKDKNISYDKVIYIWDKDYFKRRDYSLKKLVFIYESLCEIPCEIISGNSIEVLDKLSPSRVLLQYPVDSHLLQLADHIADKFTLEYIYPNDFVTIDSKIEYKRFFKFWNKAKKTAFLIDGKK